MRAPEEARADARLAINGGDPVVCPTQSIEVEVDLSWAAEQARCLVGEQRAFAWYGGPLQREFEERFAKFAGSQLAVMCSSGTAALLLTCTALGIQPGST
ncbi:MAG: aminotransferase class I/II-fold pyridoxal phosphate-dependent enzyme, partial [Ktedonobacteraceae bacterium]